MNPELLNEIITKKFQDVTKPNKFYLIMSIYDGIVLHTFSVLPTILGFKKKLWPGRSFIEFIEQKNRDFFSTQTINEILLPLTKSTNFADIQDLEAVLFVKLRKYCGIESTAPKLNFTYLVSKLIIKPAKYCNILNLDQYMIIEATQMDSPYKIGKELVQFGTFQTRHNADCILSHVDYAVVENFGFLPQDMENKLVFDFYHPCDMLALREIYKTIVSMNEKGESMYRSKPYRFIIQNGDCVLLETEWYSYVDPWSKSLQFITGIHKVLQGPKYTNIFSPCDYKYKGKITVKVLKESEKIRREIILLLNKKFERPKRSKHEINMASKVIMEELIGPELESQNRLKN